MAIELITGVGADNHISSNDFRAFNRANFGQGKYILNDAEKMYWFVMASAGEIHINTGSLLWSGMHIRNASNIVLKYIAPSTSTTVYVYLHYTKNTDTLVENVAFEVSVGKTLTPVVDSLNDNTIEAYTLFCSFTATSSSATNYVYGFQSIRNIDEVEKLIRMAHEETVLFEGEAQLDTTINLSETFRNFYEICFVSHHTHTQMLTSIIPPIGDVCSIAMTGSGKWNNAVGGFVDVRGARLRVVNERSFKVEVLTRSLVGSGAQSEDPTPITKIIGIGRKN